ncbi:uncharacterized protein LOC112680367 isoform X2 [Sipha flava]|uniref:Uncharacterized protein LOC112680367 isoform X2 n=1 Tax=Sipha flava TaxID=143950 RepID=A0A8B8F7C4_9HEMI|nr:uncharacterized protein LOC112680367 isoform X2 [Sipha flava]
MYTRSCRRRRNILWFVPRNTNQRIGYELNRCQIFSSPLIRLTETKLKDYRVKKLRFTGMIEIKHQSSQWKLANSRPKKSKTVMRRLRESVRKKRPESWKSCS